MPPIETIDGSCETSDGLALHYRAWLVRWDGFYHEMFNEPDRETVFRRMEAWLAARGL